MDDQESTYEATSKYQKMVRVKTGRVEMWEMAIHSIE